MTSFPYLIIGFLQHRQDGISISKLTSHERFAISHDWQLDWLFNSLFRITTKKTSKLHITGLLLGVIHQWPVEPNVESVSISQHHHDIETVPSSLPFSFSNETGCRFMVICSIEQCYRFSPVFYGQCHHHRQLKWYFSPTCVNIMIRPRTSWTIYIARWWSIGLYSSGWV